MKQYDSWQRILVKTQATHPDFIRRWGSRARAYQLRYLARRATRQRQGAVASDLLRRSLASDWRILLEEPRRTLITLLAAYLLRLLPEGLYRRLERLMLRSTGASQKRLMRAELEPTAATVARPLLRPARWRPAMKILLVCSSGGHFKALQQLADFWQRHPHLWITFRTPTTETALAGERVLWALQPHQSQPAESAAQPAAGPPGDPHGSARPDRLHRRRRCGSLSGAGEAAGLSGPSSSSR